MGDSRCSKLEIVRFGTTLDISDEIRYVHASNEGFGMAPLHRLSERGPQQHGMTDRGFRLDPRNINLVITILADDWDIFYANRSELLRFLSPVWNVPVVLRFTLPDGLTVRQLDTFSVGGPAFASSDMILYTMQKVGFTLMAPNPAWYDPTQQALVIGGVSSVPGLTVEPFYVEFFVGGASLAVDVTLQYAGSWIEYPIIEFHGPLANALLVNNRNGKKLDFSQQTIDAGHVWTVDLRYGYKTVTDQTGANQISKLSTDSDLVDWVLEPGANDLFATGTGGDEDTQVIIRYYNRYIGV